MVLSRCVRENYFESGKKLGVVVDSKLGDLPRINSRKLPYFGAFYLPPYVTLIYASDAMTDGLPNQLIRFCDAAAKSIFKELDANRLPVPMTAFSDVVRIHPSSKTVAVRDLLQARD